MRSRRREKPLTQRRRGGSRSRGTRRTGPGLWIDIIEEINGSDEGREGPPRVEVCGVKLREQGQTTPLDEGEDGGVRILEEGRVIVRGHGV